jgi:hypothetical protein
LTDSAASSLDGLSERDDDATLDEVFANTDMQALVGYLKSSVEPLYELIMESYRLLERPEDILSLLSLSTTLSKED